MNRNPATFRISKAYGIVPTKDDAVTDRLGAFLCKENPYGRFYRDRSISTGASGGRHYWMENPPASHSIITGVFPRNPMVGFLMMNLFRVFYDYNNAAAMWKLKHGNHSKPAR